MTHEGPLEEWMKKLSEESLKDNTFDRRRFIQGAGKIAGLSLGLAIAQLMGAMEVNAAPKVSWNIRLHLALHREIRFLTASYCGQGWRPIR